MRVWGGKIKSKTKGNFSSYLPRKGEGIFHHFSSWNTRIWSDVKIVETTNRLRWAGEGFPGRQCCCALSGAAEPAGRAPAPGKSCTRRGNQFKSTNELREVSPPDSHTIKSKSLCIFSKPWLSTSPKPWAGPGCEIPENQSPASPLAPFPREGAPWVMQELPPSA